MQMNVRCLSFFNSCLMNIPDMIIDNDPPIERHISVPKDMSQLSCSSFTAGIVEAVLDGLGFVCFYSPFRTSTDSDLYPARTSNST